MTLIVAPVTTVKCARSEPASTSSMPLAIFHLSSIQVTARQMEVVDVGNLTFMGPDGKSKGKFHGDFHGDEIDGSRDGFYED